MRLSSVYSQSLECIGSGDSQFNDSYSIRPVTMATHTSQQSTFFTLEHGSINGLSSVDELLARSGATNLSLLVEDTTNPTMSLLQQIHAALPSSTIQRIFLRGQFSAAPPAPAILRTITAMNPVAFLVCRYESTTNVQQIDRWMGQTKLKRDQLLIDLPPSSSLSSDALSELASHAGGWFIREPDVFAALNHTLTTSIVFAPRVPSDESIAPLLFAIDRIEPTQFSHIHFAIDGTQPDSVTTTLRQHWSALKGRIQFRLKKSEAEAELKRKLDQHQSHTQIYPRPYDPSTTDINSSTSATSPLSSSSSSSTTSTHVGPVLFYRASFTPTLMYYRIAIHFSPSQSTSKLVAHGLLSESVKSFLGLVGSSQASVQLLEWNETRSDGIIATEAKLAVGVRAAFMLMGMYQQKPCRIEVKQQSLFLPALATSL